MRLAVEVDDAGERLVLAVLAPRLRDRLELARGRLAAFGAVVRLDRAHLGQGRERCPSARSAPGAARRLRSSGTRISGAAVRRRGTEAQGLAVDEHVLDHSFASTRPAAAAAARARVGCAPVSSSKPRNVAVNGPSDPRRAHDAGAQRARPTVSGDGIHHAALARDEHALHPRPTRRRAPRLADARFVEHGIDQHLAHGARRRRRASASRGSRYRARCATRAMPSMPASCNAADAGAAAGSSMPRAARRPRRARRRVRLHAKDLGRRSSGS
jgi:hypothetical protein